MNLKKCRARISELMSIFVVQVENDNEMGMLDINRVSEDVLIPLFSEIYGYTGLKNLNVFKGTNSPAIDLGDKETKTAYQITSRRDFRKIKETLEKFVGNELYKEYNRLIIYVLTKKQDTYRGEFDEIIGDKLSFDKKNDICDHRDLLKEILGFSVEKSLKVLHILEQHFGEGREDDEPQDILDWLEQINDSWGEESGKIKINRENLRNDLLDFALRGNGVVIGSPGVGKTYLLNKLHQHLKSTEIPHLLLPIDQLGKGTSEDLQSELSYKGDLIKKLKSVSISDKKAILLFDAFDAARNEDTRRRFLRLIQRAIHELKDSWNVVVTVRTYDAMKSQELLDLFGDPDDTQHKSDGISCRHFTIPPFDKDEILQAFGQIRCRKSVYDDGSDDFKKILAKPFNLWLLEKILGPLSKEDLTALSQIRSEVQLLDRFWQQRIKNETSERVLHRISHRMVEKLSLTVRVDDIYDDVDLDNPVRKTAWDKLQSDEILAKVSSTGQRISFSHNILFDYAISVLLIDDEPQHLEDFILDDVSRPLFLRPSLTYFFTRLWYYDDSTNFWRAFWHILQRDQSVPLRLVAHLVPTSVIANEASEIKQLTPFLEKLQNGEEIASKAIMWLFQSLRTLQIEHDALWVDFFDQVSVHLHADFAWDLANLTSDTLEGATDAKIKGTCGRIGRRLLEWVWQEREKSESDWYNRLGGYWAVPLVAKTYHRNVQESRVLLQKVIELMQEDNFPITFLARLTEHVDKIWEYDPKFVAQIYLKVFDYYEISDEKIIRGGPILPMATLRHQDYRMCQYKLVKHLPNFFQALSSVATQTVIQSLNSFIIGTRVIKNLQRGMALEDMMDQFDFRGNSAFFVEDNSYIWDAQNSSDESIEMADVLFEFIAELARLEDVRLDSLLDVFRDEVITAFFWKRLLKTASQFPEVFAPRLFELCIAKPIQLHLETSYELSLFLKNAAPVFTSEQLRQIEESLLALPRKTKNKDNPKFLKLQRDSLLAEIPENLLCTDEGKRIREKMERDNNVPKNRPLVSSRTWSEPVTEEKWLQRQGVDTTKPDNQELQRFSEHLNKFSSDWRNDTPTQESIELILPRLQKVYAALQSDTKADQKVINLLWRNLIDCVAILGRVANNLESKSFAFCRQVLLEGAEHEEPKPNPLYDDQFDGPGYPPFPRHKASQGLLRLAFHQPDEEILDAIEVLANDPVPSVRMVTAMELSQVYDKAPEKFWHIVENRAADEPNSVVQEYLYFTLTQVITEENEDKTTYVMAKLLEHTPSPPGKLASFDPFSFLLMRLAIGCQNSWALETIEDRFFKNPIRFSNLLTRAVSQVMKDYVAPKYLKTPNGHERARRAIEWLAKVIDVVSNSLGELHKTLKEHETEKVAKQLHRTYEVIDRIITRLYYEVAHEKGQSDKQTSKISPELRGEFYNEVKPLMKQVIDFAQNPEHGLMFAPTAHYFMKLLTSFLSCNPKEVLHLAAGVVKSSEPFGYNLDAIAVMDVVEFVEIVLADYRHEVRDDEECLEDLLNLLDMFAKTGWTDALKLVWRLDEVFR